MSKIKTYTTEERKFFELKFPTRQKHCIRDRGQFTVHKIENVKRSLRSEKNKNDGNICLVSLVTKLGRLTVGIQTKEKKTHT